jgi:hypothetical protein
VLFQHPTPTKKTYSNVQQCLGQEANMASGTVAVDANSSGHGGLAANVPNATVELVEAVEEARVDEAAEAAKRGCFCRLASARDPSAKQQSTPSSNINGHD